MYEYVAIFYLLNNWNDEMLMIVLMLINFVHVMLASILYPCRALSVKKVTIMNTNLANLVVCK